MSTSNTIHIEVELNDQRIPANMRWSSSDGPSPEASDCKAFLLSIFERHSKETLKIDLWTEDMQLIEMDRLMYYTLRGLADSYFRATQNGELANDMRQFAHHFGQRTEILPPDPGSK